jgi:hypothetical protein
MQVFGQSFVCVCARVHTQIDTAHSGPQHLLQSTTNEKFNTKNMVYHESLREIQPDARYYQQQTLTDKVMQQIRSSVLYCNCYGFGFGHEVTPASVESRYIS